MTITQAYAPTVIDRLNAEWAVRYADVPHAWPHGEQTGDQLRQSVSEAPREEREQLMRGLLEQAAQGDEHCGRGGDNRAHVVVLGVPDTRIPQRLRVLGEGYGALHGLADGFVGVAGAKINE